MNPETLPDSVPWKGTATAEMRSTDLPQRAQASLEPPGPAATSAAGSEVDTLDVRDDWDDASTCTSWTDRDDTYQASFVGCGNPGHSGRPLVRDAGQEHILRERLRSVARERRQAAGETTSGRAGPARHHDPVQHNPLARSNDAGIGAPHYDAHPPGLSGHRGASAGREISEHPTMMRVPGVFPPIEEHLQEPAHSHDTLSRVVAEYNTLTVSDGLIGAMLKANSVGLANVPTASLLFTSRPMVALATRWQACFVTLLCGAAMLIMAYNMLHGTVSDRAGVPMRWLKVDHIKVYENVFPDFNDAATAAQNRLLTLEDGGVFVDSHNLRQLDGCSTNITSPTSFLISCAHTVRIHGIWILVTGSSRVGLSGEGRSGGAKYDYAGVEYAYEVGESAKGAGVRRPGEQEVFNVMGTGQSLRGVAWHVLPSETSMEGLFRISTAEIPLSWARWKGVVDFVVYALVGLLLCTAGVLGLAQKAEQACICFTASTAVVAASICMVYLVDFVIVIGAQPAQRDLTKVLYGLTEDVRLDLRCDGAADRCLATLGLNTAYLLVSINLLYSLVWCWWSYFVCRGHVSTAFGAWMPAVAFEICFQKLHPLLSNPVSLYFAIVCGISQVAFERIWLLVLLRLSALLRMAPTATRMCSLHILESTM